MSILSGDGLGATLNKKSSKNRDVSKGGLKTMSFGAIRIGDKVEISCKNAPDLVYFSKVANILDAKGHVISIETPVLDGASMPLETEGEYNVIIVTSQVVVRHRCVFEGYLKEDLNLFVAIRIIDEGEKMQRREFFRFTCLLAMRFSVMDFEKGNQAANLLHAEGYAASNEGVIRDIGGGGIRFITNADLSMDYNIQCIIMLGSTAMKVKARILEKQYMPKSNRKFQYRASFVDISNPAKDEIIDYIFTEQRRHKKTAQAVK